MNKIVPVVIFSLATIYLGACSKKSDSTTEQASVSASTATPAPTAKPEIPTFEEYKASLKAAINRGENVAQNENMLGAIERGESGKNINDQFWLGANFRDGGLFKRDIDKAFKLLNAAAEKGQPSAQWFMGVMYEHGESVPVDLEKAKAWYTKASQSKDKDVAERAGISLKSLSAKSDKR